MHDFCRNPLHLLPIYPSKDGAPGLQWVHVQHQMIYNAMALALAIQKQLFVFCINQTCTLCLPTVFNHIAF